MKIYSSYKSLFRIKYAISRIGDFTLPREVPLDAIIVFIVAYYPLYPLGLLLTGFLYPGHPYLVNAITTAFFAWWASKFDPQGKQLPAFLGDLMFFFFRKKNIRLNGENVRFVPKKIPIGIKCWEL